MSLKFLPVIELGYYNQGNPMPDIGGKVDFTEEWIRYRTECLRLGGMPNPVPPRYKGTDFYRFEDFFGENLKWLIKQHIADYIEADPEQICPFFGGYILCNDSEYLLYPQCCGDLSDIIWWKHICYSSKCYYYNGHPCPEIRFSDTSILFECEDDPDDSFDCLSKRRFEVSRGELVEAYEKLIPIVIEFRKRVACCLRSDKMSISPDQLSIMLTTLNPELNESNVDPDKSQI